MEEAVIAALIGEETQKAIADRHGVTRAELQRWVETYRTTGRAALGKLP
jgi:transposase-like protein